MYKVDEAWIHWKEAKRRRSAQGAMTTVMACCCLGMGVWSAGGQANGVFPFTAWLVLFCMWASSAKRFHRASLDAARWESKYIKEKDKFEAELERKMEW